MPIRPSASAEIRQLIGALGGVDETRRESALARLAVIGPRALEHLLEQLPASSARARVGILRALERLADARAGGALRAALDDPSAAVQTAAIGALRSLLGSGAPAASRDAFDAVVAVALDRRRIAPVRLAAWEALNGVTADAREAVRHALLGDPDVEVRARVADASADGGGEPRSVWEEAGEGRLPSSPGVLKIALAAHRASARLTDLQKLVERIRAREEAEPDGPLREEWRAVRGAVHQALAARSSRLALYDLRDSLLASGRLPIAFLAALEEIGDATCLETLAAAYDESAHSGGDPWWREHLASAFRAIVQREGLTRRHAAVKRAMARWPDATADLMGGR